jgi:YesN/AraC family two-component response regulator
MYPFYEASKSNNYHYFTMFKSQNLSFPPHLHASVEIIYILSGEIDVTINGITNTLHCGDLALSFPNDIHSYKTIKNSELLLIIFNPELISSYFGSRMHKTLENHFLYNNTLTKETLNLLDMLYDEFKTSNNEYVIKGLLYSILGRIDEHINLKDCKYQFSTTIQVLLKYIESHYSENITLESIANDLGYSKFYLSRIFTNKIGYHFNDYLNRLRINKAQSLLSESSMSISEIALECGYESLRNFNRVFKQYSLITPTEFRNN